MSNGALPVVDFKRGWKTSEFWVALVGPVIFLLSVLGVDVDEESTTNLVVGLTTGVGAVYALARTWLKVNRLKFLASGGQVAGE